MPKVVCPKCGKVFYGWSLKHKISFCDCGALLNLIRSEVNEYERGN